jgi:hypothetical protein
MNNRSSSPYRVAIARIYDQRGVAMLAKIKTFNDRGQGLDEVVPSGDEVLFKLHVRGAERLSGQTVSLEISEPGGGRRVRIDGIEWPSR